MKRKPTTNDYCKTPNCGAMRGPNKEGWITPDWEWVCEDCHEGPTVQEYLEERLEGFPVQVGSTPLNDRAVASAYYDGKQSAFEEVLEFVREDNGN